MKIGLKMDNLIKKYALKLFSKTHFCSFFFLTTWFSFVIKSVTFCPTGFITQIGFGSNVAKMSWNGINEVIGISRILTRYPKSRMLVGEENIFSFFSIECFLYPNLSGSNLVHTTLESIL